LEEISSIAQAVERARAKLNHRGRVFLRYSGTEPLLRILVEGRDGDEVLRIADDLEAAVRAELE
jgi:phosphoglucosamine mutase